MRQIFYLETEPVFQRACELRQFGDRGDISWREWYNYNTERTQMQSGELEQALAEVISIPIPARNGFAITGIDHETVIVQDLEECGTCNLNDGDDAHMILPVTQFREWLYNWSKNPINRVMGTDEASALWGLSKQRIKVLCEEGKLEARKIGNSWIMNRNQPNPKMK
jgi:hypothetical protein